MYYLLNSFIVFIKKTLPPANNTIQDYARLKPTFILILVG